MNKKEVSTPDKILENIDQASEDLAKREAENISDEKLEYESRRNEYSRKERSRTILHQNTIYLIRVLYIITMVGIGILAYHWFCPKVWHFLAYDQLDTIKNLLFSALATNTVKEWYKKNM